MKKLWLSIAICCVGGVSAMQCCDVSYRPSAGSFDTTLSQTNYTYSNEPSEYKKMSISGSVDSTSSDGNVEMILDESDDMDGTKIDLYKYKGYCVQSKIDLVFQYSLENTTVITKAELSSLLGDDVGKISKHTLYDTYLDYYDSTEKKEQRAIIDEVLYTIEKVISEKVY